MSARLSDDFDVAQVPLFPQRGEGPGVTGGNVDGPWELESDSAQSPLTPTLSPLRGEGTAIVRFLKLGRVSIDCRPTVFDQEILQARALFPPVS